MRQPGASFGSPQSGRVFTQGADGGGALVDPTPVSGMGEGRIAQSTALRSQSRERVLIGMPKSWRITNRARLGHVKVWSGTFDGERYPEGATDDRTTWLQPGESMLVSMEAGLHFVGNVFDPRMPEAKEVIERCGGFELETEATAPGRNAPVRIIGGPIGLPDFIVEPMDGRGRLVGSPVAVYEAYDRATRKFWVRRKGHDKEVVAAERELLAERIAEYTMDDAPLYGPNGDVVSTEESRAEAAGDELPDMRAGETLVADDDDDGEGVESTEPVLTPRKRQR